MTFCDKISICWAMSFKTKWKYKCQQRPTEVKVYGKWHRNDWYHTNPVTLSVVVMKKNELKEKEKKKKTENLVIPDHISNTIEMWPGQRSTTIHPPLMIPMTMMKN